MAFSDNILIKAPQTLRFGSGGLATDTTFIASGANEVTLAGNLVINGSITAGAVGDVFFVDTVAGSNSNNGKSWTNAFSTMTYAIASADANDTICFVGNVLEECTIPCTKHNLTIVGLANRPRHTDSEPGVQKSASWRPPTVPTAATSLLAVEAPAVRLGNILFACPTDAAAVKLVCSGSGATEKDGQHAHIFGNVFQGGLYGVQDAGGASRLVAEDNLFMLISESGGAGIKCSSTSVRVAAYNNIRNNRFMNNASHILASMSYSAVTDNIFGHFTATLSVDLQSNAAQGEYNVITRNYLSGTYGATAYPPGTNNEWGGNYNSLAGGLTGPDPA